MENIIAQIQRELERISDEKIHESSQHFFKEQIKCYGIKNEAVHKISRDYFRLISGRAKDHIFNLCDELWQSGFIEESFIACNWSYFIHEKYEPEDFQVFKKWISSYVNNWASCDTLCNHTVGEFIEMYPQYLPVIKEFAKSDNRWMRRASAVSLIGPARKGKFLNEILELADLLLLDKDDMVQKGYGWMLKAASQAHQKEIFEYVISKKAIMPRTALRYAIEKMPKDLKAIAMER